MRKELLWLAVGVFLALILETTLAGILNPILAPVKLSYS
jgi:hypothetical protein